MEDTLTWLDAEQACKRQGAQLISIKSESQMLFVNFILVSQHEAEDIYIGKNIFVSVPFSICGIYVGPRYIGSSKEHSSKHKRFC